MVSVRSSIPVVEVSREVDILIDAPTTPVAVIALAHGAGAGMEHPFMQAVAEDLVECGIVVVRYQFPYMQKRIAEGKRWGRPDPPTVLEAVVESVARGTAERFPNLPLFAGGKSLGGRMTSRWVARSRQAPGGLGGLVFFGFPLHPADNPGVERAAHLKDIKVPMLFLQGDRDRLADLALLRPVVDELESRATLHVVEGADHGFDVLKRSGRTDSGVMAEITTAAADWMLG